MMVDSRRRTIVTNNSGATADFVRQRLSDGESFEISDRDLNLWRDDPTVSGLIGSGALLVNDGFTTLSSGTTALDHFFDAFPAIEAGPFVNVTKVSGKIVIEADAQELTTTVINPGVSNYVASEAGTQVISDALAASASGIAAIQQALQNSPPVGQAGSVFQIPFSYEGNNSKDRWLCTGGDTGITSDKSPAVMPFDCKIIAMTFTNRENDADTDLEIYSVLEANTNEKEIEFIWALRDCRAARKSNFSPEITFNAGDRVAVYLKDRGSDPDYPVLTLYLQITSNNNEEVIRGFSGNFSVGSGNSGS